MREEDEIRAAVTALAAAMERGEDIGDELPSAELLAERAATRTEVAPATPEEAQEQMLAAVFAAVRTASRESRLSRPADWEAQGLVPEGLTAEDVEMAVYERMAAYLAAEGEGEAVASPAGTSGIGSDAAPESGAGASGGVIGRRPVNKHVDSPFSSSNGRAVGMPAFKRRKAAEDAPASREAAGSNSEEGFETEELSDAEERSFAGALSDGEGLSCPEERAGAEELSGAKGLSCPEEPRGGKEFLDARESPHPASSSIAERPSDPADSSAAEGFSGPGDPDGPAGSGDLSDTARSDDSALSDGSSIPDGPSPVDEFGDCRGIGLLMGASSYYLYDRTAMTDAYARWAFLAAEDDPVATFLECVREESSVYPRPMAVTSLANDPFRMDAAAVEDAFAAARAQGRADDIERTEASNGDVYFYSTRFLTPRRAEALAEWDAVERFRNV